MRVASFGYKNGVPSAAGHVIDCRAMGNPHRSPFLRDLDGRDPAVARFIKADPLYGRLLSEGLAAARLGQDVAYGCYGGRHRSVVMAEELKRELEAVGVCVTVHHTSLAND